MRLIYENGNGGVRRGHQLWAALVEQIDVMDLIPARSARGTCGLLFNPLRTYLAFAWGPA